MPPTHHKGSKPRILQKGVGVRGDHKNMFIDVDTESLIGNPLFKTTRPEICRLKLNDPRIKKSFLKSAVGPPNQGRAQAPYSSLSFCLLGKK